MDIKNKLSGLRIPEPIKWAAVIWIGYTATNVALMALGYLKEPTGM